MWDDIRVGSRFIRQLPRFLRTPISVDAARARVQARLRNRAANLYALLHRIATSPHRSPYARLLANCGCEPGDVAQLIDRQGVEGALAELLANGVYLTGDEFKGRVPVTRGSVSFTIDPGDLISPSAVVHGVAESSGSRGARTPVPIDLAFIADHAVNTLLTLHAHDGHDWIHAHWGVPGGTSVTNPLEFAKGGTPPEKWFTPIEPGAPGLHPRYRWGARAMWLASRVAGVPMPGPTLAPLNDPTPIVRWMAAVLQRGQTPHLWTFASSAVLVCAAAIKMGVDIRGARFTAGGEPTTTARRHAVENAGAVMIPRMGTTETDILSYACRHPAAPDDMHFFHDRHAVIQPGDGGPPALPAKALLLTSLLPTAPIHLLNVCFGDQATIALRRCGCPMEGLGWPQHISNVRSFEKLTAGGITLLDYDVVRVLEDVLPARFGGTSLDYQIVEHVDTTDGRPRVQLFISPQLDIVDTKVVREVFLKAIGGGTSGEHLMALQWHDGQVVDVVRDQPRRTASGKIHHVFAETSIPRQADR